MKISYKQTAKKLKSNTLPKHSLYCKYCFKQFRDYNGFQNHKLADNHKKNLAKCAADENRLCEIQSEKFLREFLALKNKVVLAEVRASELYQQLIRTKTHTRLVTTRWQSLSAFLKYGHRNKHFFLEERKTGFYILTGKQTTTREEEPVVSVTKKEGSTFLYTKWAQNRQD